jgi:hypothetical protein
MISGFVDEASETLSVQIDVMKKLGMKYIEPRLVDGKNVIKLSDEELEKMRHSAEVLKGVIAQIEI